MQLRCIQQMDVNGEEIDGEFGEVVAWTEGNLLASSQLIYILVYAAAASCLLL